MSAPQIKDIRTAIALLTRLPIKAEFDRTAQASWAYPLAGTLLGLLGAFIACVALWIGLDPAAAAGFYLAATIFLSGAMHEDGLADSADGFWGGWDPARRLEIMKDSAIGTYGVLALGLSLILRWAMIWALMETPESAWFRALIAIETLSRAIMPLLMHTLPNARADGLSQSQGRPDLYTAGLSLALAFTIALLAIGLTALGLFILALLSCLAMGMLAQKKIQGQTGDTLGAAQQLTALALLVAIA